MGNLEGSCYGSSIKISKWIKKKMVNKEDTEIILEKFKELEDKYKSNFDKRINQLEEKEVDDMLDVLKVYNEEIQKFMFKVIELSTSEQKKETAKQMCFSLERKKPTLKKKLDSDIIPPSDMFFTRGQLYMLNKIIEEIKQKYGVEK